MNPIISILLLSLPVICTEICPTGWASSPEKCWLLINDPMEQAKAEDYCGKQYGGALVALPDWKENEAVQRYIGFNSVKQLWIGLTCTGSSPASCSWTLDRGGLNSYTNFTSTSPNPKIGDCLYYDINTRLWNSENCDAKYPFICEVPHITDPCPYNYGDYCFYPITTPLKFGDAQDYCARSCSNLASIRSGAENQYLKYLFNSSTVMLGAVATSLKNLIWVDFSDQLFKNLKTFDQGNCVFTHLNSDNSGSWFTDNVIERRYLLVEDPLGWIVLVGIFELL